MPIDRKDPCKRSACRIQDCLKRKYDNRKKENNFQESACLEVLEAMRQCCLKFHKKSNCCSGIKLDKPYITIPEEKSEK